MGGGPVTPQQVWQAALSDLERTLKGASFQTFVKNTSALADDGETFTIAASTTFAKEWLETRLRPRIEAALGEIRGRRPTLAVVVEGIAEPPPPRVVDDQVDVEEDEPEEEAAAEPRPKKRGGRARRGAPERPLRHLAHGYARTPTAVTREGRLSLGARVTYDLLMGYSWGKGECDPGLHTLALDLGVSGRSVHTYLDELVATNLVKVVHRGRGLRRLFRLRHWFRTDEAGRAEMVEREWPALVFDMKVASPQRGSDMKQKEVLTCSQLHVRAVSDMKLASRMHVHAEEHAHADGIEASDPSSTLPEHAAGATAVQAGLPGLGYAQITPAPGGGFAMTFRDAPRPTEPADEEGHREAV